MLERDIQRLDDLDFAKELRWWKRGDKLLRWLSNSYCQLRLPRVEVDLGKVRLAEELDHYENEYYFESERERGLTPFLRAMEYYPFPAYYVVRHPSHKTIWVHRPGRKPRDAPADWERPLLLADAWVPGCWSGYEYPEHMLTQRWLLRFAEVRPDVYHEPWELEPAIEEWLRHQKPRRESPTMDEILQKTGLYYKTI